MMYPFHFLGLIRESIQKLDQKTPYTWYYRYQACRYYHPAFQEHSIDTNEQPEECINSSIDTNKQPEQQGQIKLSSPTVLHKPHQSLQDCTFKMCVQTINLIHLYTVFPNFTTLNIKDIFQYCWSSKNSVSPIKFLLVLCIYVSISLKKTQHLDLKFHSHRFKGLYIGHQGTESIATCPEANTQLLAAYQMPQKSYQATVQSNCTAR